MKLFCQKKKKPDLEERLQIAEARLVTMRQHLNLVTKSSLYLSLLIKNVTTQEMQVWAKAETEKRADQVSQVTPDIVDAPPKDESEDASVNELWRKYGNQNLRGFTL